MSVHGRLPSSPSVPSGIVQGHAGASDLSSDGLMVLCCDVGSCHMGDGSVKQAQQILWAILAFGLLAVILKHISPHGVTVMADQHTLSQLSHN